MKTVSVLLFFVLFAGITFSQHRTIVLTNPQGQDTWFIREGDRIKYEMRADFHGMYKGKIRQIKDSSMMVNGKEIFFSKIKTVKLSRGPARKSIFLGMVLAGIGVAAKPLNDKSTDALPDQMILVGQVAFIGSGLYFIVRGIVELASHHKINLYEGWGIRSIPVATMDE